jgi:two-component system chemotaxis response regulator CheB/chemosensory pili system protein ChpB (putative protein-glutamate methylesterase)
VASSADLAEVVVSVALIGRRDEARAQLQAALTEFGAAVVFEGEPPEIDLAALQRSAPGVVIVNLDPGIEDALDSLQPVLDDPDVNVVFNEAEVTRQLGGWDLARWARHLAAKVLGHGDTNPPPPANAERLPGQEFMPRPGAPPTPEQLAGERMIEEFTVEADDHADAIPTDYLPMQVDLPGRQAPAEAAGFDLDFDAIEGAMATAHARPDVAPTAVPDSEAAGEDAPIDLGIDLSVLDAALSPPAPAATRPSPRSEAELLDEALGDFNLDLDAEGGLAVADDLPGLDADPADGDAPVSFAHFGGDEDTFELDENVAELAAQLDQIAAGVPAPAEQASDAFDFSVDDLEPAPEAALAADQPARAETPAQPAAATASSFDFSALSLAPIEGEGEEGKGAAAAPVATAGAAGASFDFGSLDLALEPLDGEQATGGTPAESTDAIQRVVVLGASIGGPDALRSFLGGIPAGFPALFMLAQHLDNGFFERLAQQLQKSSKLPVRVADPSTTAKHGEVLVVPSDARIAVEPDGSIVAEPHGEQPRYRPCIDDVLRDVADRFGARATAIVFSGMAGDAIEGSVYLTGRGGEVWAQTPASCVVSSMVDGATARGVVEFTGTPRELADQCVARYGR